MSRFISLSSTSRILAIAKKGGVKNSGPVFYCGRHRTRYNRSPSPLLSLAERGGSQRSPWPGRSSWCSPCYALLLSNILGKFRHVGQQSVDFVDQLLHRVAAFAQDLDHMSV